MSVEREPKEHRQHSDKHQSIHSSQPEAGISEMQSSYDQIVNLQHLIGNQAVQRMLADGSLDAQGRRVVQREDTAGGGAGFLSSRRGFSLLGPDEQLRLDPQIQAQIRMIQLMHTQLDPANVGAALRSINLNLPASSGLAGSGAPSPFSVPNAPAPQPVVPRGAGPDTPRAANLSDLMDAVMGVPAVDHALTNLKTSATARVRTDWNNLGTGGKVALITTSALIGGGALAGALSNPESRHFLLSQVEGRDIPVPAVPGLSFQFNLTGPEQKIMFMLDLSQFLP